MKKSCLLLLHLIILFKRQAAHLHADYYQIYVYLYELSNNSISFVVHRNIMHVQ